MGFPLAGAPEWPSRSSTALRPARATNRVLPSGERAKASGWAPTGVEATRTDSGPTTVGVPAPLTSRTETVSSLVLATNRRGASALGGPAAGGGPAWAHDRTLRGAAPVA